MATNKKIPKCPPLRFPQFNDKWEQTTLGEIAEIIQTRGKSNTLYLSVESFLPNFRGISVSLNGIQSSGVIFGTYDTLMSNIRPYLRKVWYADCGGTCSSDVLVFRGKSVIHPRFLYTIIANQSFVDYTMQGAKGVKMPRGDKQQMLLYSLSLPSLAEQQKIASFLSLIDERIQSCSETIKEIKAQKSCLRTLILNTIIVRWIKLKQAVEQGIINLKRGEVIPKQSQSSENIYPVYSSSVQNKGLMGFHNSYMFDKELISWSIDGGGHLFYRPRHKFNVTNVCGVLETSCFDYVFLCEVLKEQHRKLLFDYQNKAHPSVIQELYQVPMLEISEQRYYGKLFRLLDERIEVEEELLKQYEMQKKYLLRQMFI